MSRTNKHYHAMAGLHGYMPNYNAVHPTIKSAAEDLASMHDEARCLTALKGPERYAELNLSRDGNEYAMVELCYLPECLCEEEN